MAVCGEFLREFVAPEDVSGVIFEESLVLDEIVSEEGFRYIRTAFKAFRKLCRRYTVSI